VREQPDFARAVALARQTRGPRRGARALVFAVILAAGLHGASVIASLGAAVDVPSARTREVDAMKFSTIAAVGAVSVASSAWAQNLLANGGFESGIRMPSCSWIDLHAPSSQLPGWQVTVGSIDHVRFEEPCANADFPAFAPEGTHVVDLDGVLSAGAISQSVVLEPGEVYELRFLMSGNNNCGGNEKRLRVEINGVSREFLYVCGASFPHPFEPQTMTFQAKSSAATLIFTSLSGSGCGPLIDRVELFRQPVCPADIVVDSFVGGSDLAALLTAWGTNGGDVPRADTNGDGIVDGSDLATVLGAWGPCG